MEFHLFAGIRKQERVCICSWLHLEERGRTYPWVYGDQEFKKGRSGKINKGGVVPLRKSKGQGTGSVYYDREYLTGYGKRSKKIEFYDTMVEKGALFFSCKQCDLWSNFPNSSFKTVL